MEKVLVCAEGVIAVLVQQSAGEYSVHPALGAGQKTSAGTMSREAGVAIQVHPGVVQMTGFISQP